MSDFYHKYSNPDIVHKTLFENQAMWPNIYSFKQLTAFEFKAQNNWHFRPYCPTLGFTEVVNACMLNKSPYMQNEISDNWKFIGGLLARLASSADDLEKYNENANVLQAAIATCIRRLYLIMTAPALYKSYYLGHQHIDSTAPLNLVSALGIGGRWVSYNSYRQEFVYITEELIEINFDMSGPNPALEDFLRGHVERLNGVPSVASAYIKIVSPACEVIVPKTGPHNVSAILHAMSNFIIFSELTTILGKPWEGCVLKGFKE